MANETTIPQRLKALNAGVITLDKGNHEDFEDGHCAMEVVAWLAGEGHTDAPECASRVLVDFTHRMNDDLPHDKRQLLIPYLPRMVGTAGDGQDEARSFLALDWIVRTYTPAWLDLAGLGEEAQRLRDLQPIVDLGAARAAGPFALDARNKARAARDAARDAASSALKLTVEKLQYSAIDLLDRMIDPKKAKNNGE